MLCMGFIAVVSRERLCEAESEIVVPCWGEDLFALIDFGFKESRASFANYDDREKGSASGVK